MTALRDPFTGKNVQISDKLTDRLRGRYACGPTMPNGEPEFGWRLFETPPIQHKAAARIEALEAALRDAIEALRWHDAVDAANTAATILEMDTNE